MMANSKRCHSCGTEFVPDRRVGSRQKTCSVACRKVLKKESNRRFSRRNPGYWCGRYDVVKAWREAHHGYQQEWRRRRRELLSRMAPDEIQAEMFSKAIDAVQESVYRLREIQAGKQGTVGGQTSELIF